MPRGKRNHFPGVSKQLKRGRVCWRFKRQRNGVKIADVYLPGPYGSKEFIAAYEAAVNGTKPQKYIRADFGTLAYVIERYLSEPGFKDLSDVRRRDLRAGLEWLRQQAGPAPVADFKVRHVEEIMGRKDGPSAANKVRKNLSMLFNYAVRLELMASNPARLAKARKERDGGYHTWTKEEITQFEAHHGAGSVARLALRLVLYTGAARQDLVKLGWQNVKEGRITYSRGKTGQSADLPIHPALSEELEPLPREHLLFLNHSGGRPYKPETFANRFKDFCADAGLPHCSIHGLRKAGATLLAEYGATEHEIMAFLAHKTPHEAATYTKAAARAGLADSGLRKLPPTMQSGGNPVVQALVNKGEKR